MTSITIPNSVTSIGGWAFEDCKDLTSITIPNSVTSIGEGVFWWCSSLTSVTIPNSVTSIGDYAFYSCSGLTSITIPNSVTSIGESAFGWCSGLTSITIPNSVTSIGNGVFAYCEGLTSITIPESVTSIGDDAFEGCSGLTSVNVWAEVPPTLGTDVFYNVSKQIPVYVPSCGSVSAYQSAEGWKAFTNIQGPLAEYSIAVGVNDNKMGTTKVDENTICGAQISATANYGYHFTQWSDGNIDNPRTFVLTQDTTFTAEFAPNNYTISTLSSDMERGTISGDVTTTYLDHITITATANYGYHFSHWDDYNYDNPRQVQVTEDKTYIAYFDKNTYYITKNYDSNQGYVNGATSGEYLDNITLIAEPNYAYHFVRWEDGNTDNPRTIILTQDTTFTAEFAINQYSITTTSSHFERGTTQGDATVNYLEYTTISATANYGYHFSSWNDGNTDNPRVVQVTDNKTYTAQFDKNIYKITASCDNQMGSVTALDGAEYLDEITISATANYGYHFSIWNDGNTDNPRTIILTQDTTFTAEFAINQYSITTTSSHFERGTTQGDATVNYLEYTTISATANYGYHFSSWNDGNTDNPRVVQVTDNKTYTAQFDKNIYKITASCDNQMGSVTALDGAEYLDEITISATANYGYHFSIWNDGNTDNPRTIILTQDTTFTAEFALTYSGQCGDYLYWQYAGTTLAITGAGDMWDDVPWRLFCDSITTVDIAKGATSISETAFANCKKLTKLILPASMEEIGANAFAECKKLYDIYSYAEDPPTANESSFANYNAYLYIPCESQRYYKADMVFSKFYNQECISSDKVDTEAGTVVVEPSTNSVTITWPTEDNAYHYVIEIKKDDEVFCTLTFNADGQLLNIAFAPSRSGSHPVTYAASTGNGLRFTVTSLEESTTYGYDITTKDEKDNTLSTYTGEFTTKSNVSTSVSDIQSPITDCQKLLRNGQLVIVRDGVEYNAQGQIVKE